MNRWFRHLGQAWLGLGCAAACGNPPAGETLSPADSLFEAGLSLYGDENYDSAQKTWTTALVAARSSDDQPAQARILTELGLAEWRLLHLDSARAHQQQALDLKTRLGLNDQLSRSYNGLGLVALGEARNSEAVRFFAQAIEAARAVDDSAGVARAAGNLALPAAYLGDFTGARAAARQLREAGRTRGDARWEGNGLSNEAMVDLFIGDPRPAIARLDTARQLYHRIVYRTGEQTALGHLATAWELTGDYQRSFAALDTALSIARGLGLREDEAINLRLIAELHERLGDYRRAIRYYEQADSIFVQSGGQSELGLVRRGVASAYRHLGNMSRARENGEAAAALHREAGEGAEELEDQLLLAEIEFRAGGMAAAQPRLDSARRLAEQTATRGARIAVALGGARISDLAGDPLRVLAELQRAEADLIAGDYGSEWEAAALEARASARLGQLEAAATAGRRSVAAIERLRARLPSDALRNTLITGRARVFSDLVLVLLRLGQPEEAFAVADAARSRGLLEHLSLIRSDSGTAALPRDLVDGEELLRRIDQLVQQLRETDRRPPQQRGLGAEPVDVELTSRLAAARNEYEALFVRADRKDFRASALLGAATTRVEDIRKALDPGQALIEYLLAPGQLTMFVVTRERLRVVQTDFDPAALTARVRLLRDLWGRARSDWRIGLPASRALHRTLIAPLLTDGLRGVTHLLIVPHGILGQLPFAALQDERTGRFLVQDVSLSYLPSAMALPNLAARPEIPAGWTAATGFAPFPIELPASDREVAAIRTHLAGTSTHLGRKASEAAVRAALAAEGPVHVATHGILNTRNPMFSRIELARSGSRSSRDDGRLEVHEILGLTIRSPLVFFSGCETGAGQEWSEDPLLGTGDQTLAQAVLAAGAREVISTLWRIDDQGAAAFADLFYRRISSLGVTDAFATAQRTMSVDGRFGNPYYWAGYTLSGSGRTGRESQDPGTASVSPKTDKHLSPITLRWRRQ